MAKILYVDFQTKQKKNFAPLEQFYVDLMKQSGYNPNNPQDIDAFWKDYLEG